jgi:hypothetical protein
VARNLDANMRLSPNATDRDCAITQSHSLGCGSHAAE